MVSQLPFKFRGDNPVTVGIFLLSPVENWSVCIFPVAPVDDWLTVGIVPVEPADTN